MTMTFDGSQVAAQDFAKMLTGSFKVVYTGTPAAGYSGKAAKADVQLTFTFDAFE